MSGDKTIIPVLKTVEVVPTVDTNVYAAGDQLGGIQTITGAFPLGVQNGRLETLIVVDKDKQNAEMNILFFDELPTVASVDQGALDVADAQLVDKCIGHAHVAGSDYAQLANGSVACVTPNLKVSGKLSTIYAVVQCLGTPTYSTAAALAFKYNIGMV